MSLSFLLLLFFSHLILSAWAHGEKRLAPKGQPGPAATDRNPRGSSSRQSSSSAMSSSSASSSAAASLGSQGSGLEQSSFQWSPSGRRTGSLYCRVGIGFHLQIYPDGKVNGSHEANMLKHARNLSTSKLQTLLKVRCSIYYSICIFLKLLTCLRLCVLFIGPLSFFPCL
nr:fibroblast growth factor 5 isoform X2 [Pan troglodytes]